MAGKIIVWDFDGPIVDSFKLTLELNQHQYHDVTEDVHRNLFNGNIFTELAKLVKKGITETEHNEYIEASYKPKKMELMPVEGIKDVLSALSKEFIMVINSSSGKNIISQYLEKHGLSPFFKKVYGNEIESKEEKFKLIMQDFNVASRDCILITDTLGDVLEAEKLHIPSIAVLWGYHHKVHFKSVEDRVTFVNRPEEIHNAISKQFNRTVP